MKKLKVGTAYSCYTLKACSYHLCSAIMMRNLASSLRAVLSPKENRSLSYPRPPRFSDYRDGAGAENIAGVLSVDCRIAENSTAHHTSKYDLTKREQNPKLVVRRGHHFRLTLQLSRPYDYQTDGFSFIFSFAGADNPNRGQGTMVVIPLLGPVESSPDIWTSELESAQGYELVVKIKPSPTCLIGEWNMEIDSKLLTGAAASYIHKSPIFILFNPWSSNDQVYMEDGSHRYEYVLTDTALIWRGTARHMKPAVWKYAQFEKDVLECSLYLISKIARINASSLGDAVKIARGLAAAVNSNDDNGAVMGNWSTDFGGGTPPSRWMGSMQILQEYWKTKKPVKYGQCWVFAGVLATVARAIGIPARTITTYSAAHDTQNSLTVDYFIGDDGNIMEELNSDSVWNYHVWNELWMTRPDLGEGDEDGWQAVDATPQELSNGMYRCGPASVAAVKKGQVLRPYDSGFVFSEVNADKVFWKYQGPTQPLKMMRKDTTAIGQFISTKAVGKWTREDITHTYKWPEKSKEERDTMLLALQQSENLFSRYYLNEQFNDLHFDFALRDDIVIGSPFSVAVVIHSRATDKDHNVSINLRVDAVTYTGKVGAPVKKQKFEQTIKAGLTYEVILDVTYEEYVKRMVDQGSFNIACLATVHETNFEYFAQDDFRVRKPDIKFQIDPNAVEGLPMEVSAFFNNPLPVPIKNGEFTIEGTGIPKQLKIKQKKVAEPGQEIRVSFAMNPVYGKATIIAKFQSKDLQDVDGFKEFMVIEEVENTTF